MAISNLDEYKTGMASNREVVNLSVAAATLVVGRFYDLWRANVPLGAVPTAPVALDNTTLGSIGQSDSFMEQFVVGARFSSINSQNLIVVDRLTHTGGLSGSLAVEQTTNLPTAALPRYTSGDGVMIGLTIYTAIGTTATTVTVNYTNQAGVDSRISPPVVMGSTGFNAANRCILIPFQDGDSGVRSVESVTLAATTGTAGNFGVTLFKPLYVLCVEEGSGVLSASGFITGRTFGGIPKVENGACLSLMTIGAGVSSAGAGALLLSEH
jgi:hypothetical protein